MHIFSRKLITSFSRCLDQKRPKSITDCAGASLISELDPLTVEGSSDTKWACLPLDLYGAGGVIVDVDGGEWRSEVSWTIVGPCNGEASAESGGSDEACPGGELFLDGGAPYHWTECPSPAPSPCGLLCVGAPRPIEVRPPALPCSPC